MGEVTSIQVPEKVINEIVKQKMIPCSVRKPEPGSYCLVRGKYGLIPAYVDSRSDGSLTWTVWRCPGSIEPEGYEDRTEWLPLPEVED